MQQENAATRTATHLDVVVVAFGKRYACENDETTIALSTAINAGIHLLHFLHRPH